MMSEKIFAKMQQDESFAKVVTGADRSAAFALACTVEPYQSIAEFETDYKRILEEVADGMAVGRLFNRMEQDAALVKRLDAAHNFEEFYNTCRDIVKISMEKFRNVYEALQKQIQDVVAMQGLERELTDAELDIVTGGGFFDFCKKVWGGFKKYVLPVVEVVVGVTAAVAGVVLCVTHLNVGGAVCMAASAALVAGDGINRIRKW